MGDAPGDATTNQGLGASMKVGLKKGYKVDKFFLWYFIIEISFKSTRNLLIMA
jgi:hypothetical protein